MPPSTLPYLEHAASFFAAIFIGFGVYWFIDPATSLSFFELPYPDPPSPPPPPPAAVKTRSSTSAARPAAAANDFRRTINAFGVAYGIRDVFIGVAMMVAAAKGSREVCGWMTLAAGLVAGVDGGVCRWMVGKGEWNHWGYAPVLVVLGSVMVGGLDWVPLGI